MLKMKVMMLLKRYPTSFSSKNFNVEEIRDIKIEAQPYFKQRFNEIKTVSRIGRKTRMDSI